MEATVELTTTETPAQEADYDSVIKQLAQRFLQEPEDIKDTVSQVAAALGKTDLEAALFIRDYGKPAWYILYRIETGQALEASFPKIER